MDTEQLNQALRLTVNGLTTQFADESITKNLAIIQLSEAEKEIQSLAQKNAELQAKVEESEVLLALKREKSELLEKERNIFNDVLASDAALKELFDEAKEKFKKETLEEA